MLNDAATIILRRPPGHFAAILVDATDLNWSLADVRRSKHINSYLSRVLAIDVDSIDQVNAIVLPCGFINVHGCLVLFVFDSSVISLTESLAILGPGSIRRRFTLDWNIK